MVTREVGKRGLLSVDFTQVALKLGAEGPWVEGRWTGLDEEDMRILYSLLTKDFAGAGSAASGSGGLNILAAFCAAGIQWFGKQKDVCVDDRRSA